MQGIFDTVQRVEEEGNVVPQPGTELGYVRVEEPQLHELGLCGMHPDLGCVNSWST